MYNTYNAKELSYAEQVVTVKKYNLWHYHNHIIKNIYESATYK